MDDAAGGIHKGFSGSREKVKMDRDCASTKNLM